jgi:hypothetical protein
MLRLSYAEEAAGQGPPTQPTIARPSTYSRINTPPYSLIPEPQASRCKTVAIMDDADGYGEWITTDRLSG